MAKGFGFGGGNMNNLIKQAQKMQQQMQDMQKDIENKEFEASVGGGVVKIVVTGKKEVKRVELKPEVVDPDDIETLEELIVAAFNEAAKKADETMSNELGKLTGGMNLPGMF